MLQSADHADFWFCVGAERIAAHTQIIQAKASDTALAGMLSAPMKESTAREAKIEHVTPGAFRSLLKFIYTGQCRMPNSILALAHLYR